MQHKIVKEKIEAAVTSHPSLTTNISCAALQEKNEMLQREHVLHCLKLYPPSPYQMLKMHYTREEII